jgi:hypothetical protein
MFTWRHSCSAMALCCPAMTTPGTVLQEPRFDLRAVQNGAAWYSFQLATLVVATPVVLKNRVVGALYVELSLAELSCEHARRGSGAR